MAHVTLQVYHSNGAPGQRARELVETRRIDTGSDKALTAKRAGQIIAREYPAYARVGGAGVIRTKDGWLATRSLNSTAECDYHFIWEEILIREG
jgi:hypothetical protein